MYSNLTMDVNRDPREQVYRMLLHLLEVRHPDRSDKMLYSLRCQVVIDFYRAHSDDPAECDYIQEMWDKDPNNQNRRTS